MLSSVRNSCLLLIPKCSIQRTYTKFVPKSTGILRKDIDRFIVKKDTIADRLRSSQQQLQCIGGSALNKQNLYPKQLLVVNAGFVGGKLKWTPIDIDNNSGVIIRDISVSFERIKNRRGKYVRPGSQIVKYNLDLASKLKFVDVLLIMVISLTFLCLMCIVILMLMTIFNEIDMFLQSYKYA